MYAIIETGGKQYSVAPKTHAMEHEGRMGAGIPRLCRQVLWPVLVLTAMASFLNATGVVKLELEPTKPGASGEVPSALNQVKVYIEAETTQNHSDKGLEVVAVYVNTSPTSVAVIHPKETTSIQVLTEDGWPLRLPPVAPSLLIHREPKPGEPDPRIPAVLRLGPDEEYRMAVSVTEVFPIEASTEKQTERKAPPAPAATILISPGKYKVSMRTTLIGKGEYSPGVTPSRSFVSKAVEIQLTR